MNELLNNLQPFYIGETIVTKVERLPAFKKLSKIWDLPYPSKDEKLTVLSITPHRHHDAWLVRIKGPTGFVYPQEICHFCFDSIENKFMSLTFKEVVKKEAELVSLN